MMKLTTYSLLACVTSALFVGGCKKEEEEAKDIPLQENLQASPVSEEQRILDSNLAGFNAQLKTLDEKIQAANFRISKMGKKKNWSWRNKVEIVEAKRKKVVEDAIELEKKPKSQHASGLPGLTTSLELLSRDMDQLLKKMK
jgi:nitrous oxide reductase accessory protein NosL